MRCQIWRERLLETLSVWDRKLACKGMEADYLCDGWRKLADKVRKRDGNRCRGCDRSADQISLQVHHRRYGPSGYQRCGTCWLTGVTLDDLTTLCIDCHDAITSVRRRVRYSRRSIPLVLVVAPESFRTAIRAMPVIQPDILTTGPVTPRTVFRRTLNQLLGKD